jgi:hypothetical protein
LNDAIAQLSDRAWRLLCDIHGGRSRDPRYAATQLMAEVAALSRGRAVHVEDAQAYRTHAAHWRAIERLAGGANAKQGM